MTRKQSPRPTAAFSLLELLVAMAILAAMIVLFAQIFGSASAIWLRSERRVDAFRDARAALHFMAEDLAPTYKQSVLPTLVLDSLHVDDADPTGAQPENNQQVFALVPARNQGKSDICAVGYYCSWNAAEGAYVLRRYFTDSDVTFAYLQSAHAAPKPGMTPESIFKPDPTKDEAMAEFVWNLKIVQIDAAGVPVPTYPAVYDRGELPAALEISFDAISPLSVRPLVGQNILPDFWFAPQSHIYRNQIAPAMQRFRIRVELLSHR